MLVFGIGVQAQTFGHMRFNEENGLSESFIYTLNQDERGFMWIGTGSGLFRFDGANFKRFTIAEGLAEDFVTCSYKDSQNNLWFGHFTGGLTFLRGTNFHSVVDKDLLNSSVTGIAEDSHGNIWLATQRNGLVRIDSDLQVRHYPEGLDETTILSFALTPDDRLLLGTEMGLQVYRLGNNGAPVRSHAVTGIPETRVQVIAPRHKRPGYWLGTEDEGLIEFIPGNSAESDAVVRFYSETGFPIDNVTAIVEDAESQLWVGTFGNGFARFDDKDTTERMVPIAPVSAADSLGKDIVRHIFIDKFQQIWMATYGQGLLCLAEQMFSTFRIAADSTTKTIYTSLEDHAGHMWFGTSMGLYLVHRDRLADYGRQYTMGNPLDIPGARRYTLEDGLPSNDITALYEDRNNVLWVGTRRSGICKLSPNRTTISPVDITELELSKAINSLRGDKDGHLWIATSDGAFRYNDKTQDIAYLGTRNGLAHNNIYDIFPDSKGQIWIATHTNRLALFIDPDEQIRDFAVTDTGEVANVNCIFEDKEGMLWLGTDGGGVYRYDGKDFRNFSEADGLLSNYIYHIIIDRFGTIWMAHRNGLSRFIPETNTFVQYANKGYFPFEENPIYSAYMDSHGNIWYGSEQGIIRFNWVPERTRMAPPYTFIEQIEIGDEERALEEAYELPYGSYRIRVSYLGLTFLDQEAVRYRYKLDGRDTDWSDPTAETSQTIQGLTDGEYVFHVEACNAMGRCNEKAARIAFTVAPPFWKTWWFRIVIALLLAGLLFLYVKYRVYRLNREKSELENKIRERTAELRREKEKMEAANLELEKLSLVASETDNAVFILDADGNLEWINEGFTRLTGYSYQDVLEMRKGRNFLETSTNPEIRRLLEQVIKENNSVQYESQLPSITGESIWVISTLTPILDESGKLRNIVIIDSNITDRKKAEEQIREMNTVLEQLVDQRTEELAKTNAELQQENEEHVKTAERLKVINRELDTFVYRASHDLKGPLASLLGLVDIARQELAENEVATKYLKLMERSSRRLDNILIDLIEATQVKQGSIEFAKVDVRELVDQIIESLSNRRDFSGVKFDIQIPEGMQVISDQKLLISVLQNFIDNSIKYRDFDKPIAESYITVAMDGNMIDIKVRDNGIGIKPELQKKVFDMFFRGTNQSGGSGLGLYIVKQAVEKLGGTVNMSSEYRVGTTMMARIPNRTEAELEAQLAAVEAEKKEEDENESFAHFNRD